MLSLEANIYCFTLDIWSDKNLCFSAYLRFRSRSSSRPKPQTSENNLLTQSKQGKIKPYFGSFLPEFSSRSDFST